MKRLSAWAAKLTPRQQDLALALVLAAVNVGTVLPYLSQMHPQGWAVVLLILQALPLVYRRDYPVWVFVAVGLPRSAYDHLGFGYAPVPVGPAIAYFTVMERSSTAVRWVMSIILVVGIAQSQLLPGHTEPYDLFVQLLIFGMAGFAGLLSRRNRAHLSETEARAERAESERDQQVALAAAHERTRIAREMHDVVAHHVSLMAVQAEAAGCCCRASRSWLSGRWRSSARRPGRRWRNCGGCSGCCAGRGSSPGRGRRRRWASWTACWPRSGRPGWPWTWPWRATRPIWPPG